MTTPIRPNILPPTPQAGPSQDAARTAAQKAFFEMAFGKAQATQVAAPAVTAAAPAAINRIQAAAAEAPQKVLRPGSILDIRV